MILKFADLETLRLALVADAIPAAVSATPVEAGFDDDDALWVDTPPKLSRAVTDELRRLGVQVCKSAGSVPMSEYSCWAQLLPLVRADLMPEQLGQSPVLFVVTRTEGLALLATEMLRLGNDRQSYRWLEPEDDGDPVGILRVVAPPYYTLLRAIDRIGREDAPEAFVEKAPRVWVQIGYDHPLAAELKAPENRLLLLRAPDRWEQLEEAPYRDVYEVLEFSLPEQGLRHQPGDLASRIEVPMSLKPGSDPARPELWVLTDDPIDTLNAFVQDANDEILHRLAFALGKGKDGATTIVLRARQGKQEPPVLVLNNAREYRVFKGLPNLFLPVGSRLHPQLRRDKVRQLLADDLSQVVWLAPGEDAGSFTPESLPEDAFRPLWDWVAYVLDHEKEPLQAWVEAARFDFELFVCEEENRQDKPKKTPGEDKKDKKGDRRGATPGGGLPGDDPSKFEPRKKDEPEKVLDDDDALSGAPVEPSVLQKRIKELEEAFVAVEGGLDAPERVALWPEMAQVNADLGNVDEAGLCWGNALWNERAAPVEWAWRWFKSEAGKVRESGSNAKTWTHRVTTVAKANRDVDKADLDKLLATADPNTADLRALAAYLVFAARKGTPPPALIDRLNPVQRFLEQHERVLPIRFAWLAWTHLALLSKGDVLALARARDRILERLYANGLRPEELPGFLKFAGQATSQRFRAVRDWMTKLGDLAQGWARGEGTSSGPTPMAAYIDLIFAFGLARLGDADTARQLGQRAAAALGSNDVHQFLLQAYDYRIKQALESRPHGGPLPAEQVEYLAHMERMPRYVVDRLREHSRILEPNEKIDPYRHWGGRISELDRALAELVDLTDKAEIQRRIAGLFKEHAQKGAKAGENKARILRAALALAPRVSEDFAKEMLDQVKPAYDDLPAAADEPALMERAKFLEQALLVVAHFDRSEYVPVVVKRFDDMLASQKGERAIKAMESLAGSCFKGLRKLGMRDEIDKILTRMRDVVLEGQDLAGLDPTKMPVAALQALLHVAAGWYYFGKDRQGDEVVNKVRQALFRDAYTTKEKTQLACVYATTVGQAPVEMAQKRLEELFGKLSNIRDTYTTNQYYSLSQLDVVEAVVLAVVSDDFTLGTNARRWLDDDEYLVRKRIHGDMRKMLEKQ